MSKSINFPHEHYVGMIARENDDLPLAFATPNGSDKAAEKRKASVDRWVDNNSNTTVFDPNLQRHVRTKVAVPKPIVLKNEPMAGFRLLDDIRRGGGGWGQGNVKWRVEDPRGFELEITSPNLMQIIACTVIDQSEILDRCMWAREGAENILVPVTSEVYITATANTERLAKSASFRDIKIGDTAILANGTTGRYFGKMNAIENDYSSNGYGSSAYSPFKIKLTPRHIFVNEADAVVHVVASPKLSEIIPGEEMDKDTAEHTLAQLLVKFKEKTGSWSGNHGYTFSKVKPTVTREKLTMNWNERARAEVVFEANGVWYLTRNSYWRDDDEIEAIKINQHDWVENSFIRAIDDNHGGYFRSHSRNHTKFLVSDLIALGIKCYRPQSRVTTENGAIFTVRH